MKNVVILIVIILLGIIIFTRYYDVKYVKSDVDNNFYKIRRGDATEEFLEESADTLARINERVMKLIAYIQTDNRSPSSRMIAKNLKQNYSPQTISEAAIDNRYTTFTIDKKDMHICLRTRDNKEKVYSLNTLMYVVLHELAHMGNYDDAGSPILGHGPEFKFIFKYLVEKAIETGVYQYVDYETTPIEYCGIVINSQIAD